MNEYVIVALLLLAGAVVLVWSIITVVREWRISKTLPPSAPIQPTSFGLSFEPVGDFFGSLLGCLFYVVLGLVGLFVIIWVIKRMWEAA